MNVLKINWLNGILKVFLFIVLTGNGSLSSQTVSGERLNYIMPSSESAALVKAVERSPSISIGVPDITIPIYSIPDADVSLTLSYNTSGLHVDELPSLAGMGWRLETGGFITRVVKGLPDDYPTNGYINRSLAVNNFASKPLLNYTVSDIATLKGIEPNNWDDSPDIFYYEIFGLKGKFVLSRDGEAYCYPKSNIKVTYIKGLGGAITTFKINLPNGVTAIFAEKETCAISNYAPISQNFNSSWLITEVKTNQKLIIDFIYGNDSSPMLNYSVNWKGKDWTYLGSDGSASNGSIDYTATYSRKLLSKIVTKGTMVDFKYKTTADVNFATLLKPWPSIDTLIVSFAAINDVIGDYSSALKYKYAFKHSGLNSSSDPKCKDNFQLSCFKTLADGVELPYFFSYIYIKGDLPQNGTKARDLWGYSNGASSNTTIIPTIYKKDGKITPINFTGATILRNGADRSSNYTFASIGTLYSITTPEGLTKTYHFGLNSFRYNAITHYGGGLRVDSISMHGFGTSDVNVIRYNYITEGATPVSSGKLLYHPVNVIGTSYPNNVFVSGSWTGESTFIESTYHGDDNVPFSLPVYYTRVEVTSKAPGSSIYSYDLPVARNTSSILSSDLAWSVSDPYLKQLVSSAGDCWVIFGDSDPITPTIFNLWLSPMLTRVQDISQEGYLVSDRVFNYGKLEISSVVHGLKLYPSFSGKYFHSSKIYHLSAWRVLTTQVETIYSPNGTNGVSKTTYFSYTRPSENKHFSFVKRKQECSIPGESLISKYTYCFDPEFDYSSQMQVCYTNLTECLDSVQQEIGLPYQEDIPGEELQPCYDVYDACVGNVATEEVKAISTLRDEKNFATPIAEISMYEKNGSKTVIGGSFSTFLTIPNKVVMPDKFYRLNENIDSSYFSGLSVDQTSTPYALSFDGRFRLSKQVTRYGNQSEVLEYRNEDSVYVAKVWSLRKDYPLLEAVNCRYDNVKNYNSSQQGLIRQNNRKAMITTWDYYFPLGVISETDHRVRTTYTIYNTLGQPIAIKDHDKALRRLSLNRLANQVGEPKVLLGTEPNRDAKLITNWYTMPNAMEVDFAYRYKSAGNCFGSYTSTTSLLAGTYCAVEITVMPYGGYGPYTVTFTISTPNINPHLPPIETTVRTFNNVSTSCTLPFLSDGTFNVTCRVSDGTVSFTEQTWHFTIEGNPAK